jgi:hypothetical protein
LSLSLAERLLRQQQPPAQPAQHQHQHQRQQQVQLQRSDPGQAAGLALGASDAGAVLPAVLPDAPPSPGANEVIDLLSDASPSPFRQRRSVPVAEPLPACVLEAFAPVVAAPAAPRADLDIERDEVALMVGMGYSDSKARRVSEVLGAAAMH